MGWDAYSSVELADELLIKDDTHREAFEQAVKNVLEKCQTVDGFLETGGLDCSACRDMLELAARKSPTPALNWHTCWNKYGMQQDEVKRMHEHCNWKFEFDQDQAWAYWSAREFLRVCAEQGLTIRFDH